MDDQTVNIIEAPDTCVDIKVVTIEYEDNDAQIIDINETDIYSEIEDDEEDFEGAEVQKSKQEINQKFARFERNYRMRRIKELTSNPL